VPKADAKYLSPPRGGNRIYVPPGITLEQLLDPQIPIALTEGEKKALALWRLALHKTDTARFIPVAIAGVWNWRGITGKTGGPRGERLDVKGPISDLDRIAWRDRLVYIVFDSNVHSNESVNWARKGICRELSGRGAKVDLVNLPPDCGVNGVDDLLASWGPERVLKLFANATSGARLEIVTSPQFEMGPDGIFRITSKGEHLNKTQLTTYQANSTANIWLDDGMEIRREFEIGAELLGRRSQFTLSASEFARMDWPIERLGAAAITFPNQKEYARTAIQSLSPAAVDRCIYTHTGWRHLDGQWQFFHADGAISGAGSISEVEVRLPGPLASYQLRLPSEEVAMANAAKASLNLLKLGPAEIVFPLLAASYRAVLGEADFAIHVAGETGAFKSELAALCQQHFGADLNRLHLPGSWSSTGNAIEALAFQAKDTLLVVDDFAPQGSGADISRYHSTADRVFRAAGNRSGRSRLDATAKLQHCKPPRCLILSTGEDVPRGHSIRARMLILEISKGTIDVQTLTECQAAARQGLFAEIMGAFVRWLACEYEAKRILFNARVAHHRVRALGNPAHARTPEIAASLQAGFDLFLEFCADSKVLDGATCDELGQRCWEALTAAASAQAKHHVYAEAAAKFVTLVQSLLTSGRAHLGARDGGLPMQSPGCCGWRRDNSGTWMPHGDRIGWVEGDSVYMDPHLAFRSVHALSRDLGEGLSVSEHTLRKRLCEKGLLASVDEKRETLTVRRTISGVAKSVLHFRRATLLPEISGAGEDSI